MPRKAIKDGERAPNLRESAFSIAAFGRMQSKLVMANLRSSAALGPRWTSHEASMAAILATRLTSTPALAASVGTGPGSLTDHLDGESHLDAVLDAVRAALGFRLRRGDNLFEHGCTSIKAMRLAVAMTPSPPDHPAHPCPTPVPGVERV